MSGERDRNFLVEDAEGIRTVLKIYNRTDDAPTRAFQSGVLTHLERTALPFAVPSLIATCSGAHEFTFDGIDGQREHGVVVSFVPGEPALHHVPTARRRYALGASVARLGQALETYRDPQADRVLLWDLMRLGDLAPFAVGIVDPARRDFVGEFTERFAREVAPAVRDLRPQIIHNDLSGSNVFVDPADPDAIAAIVDFGDMVRAPMVCDLAVAASYQLEATGDPIADLCEVMAGFETVTPLAEAEVFHLTDLAMARLCLRVLIPQWRVQLFPENADYILRSQSGAWALIDKFMTMKPAAARDAVLARWRSEGSR
ncbi:phosphotransferase [Aureimonas sp. AU12]|uniref:phosphotransferase n=1 Tax=Aureimonas sp. AU12 TaxID=1638161 RepID=UPI00178CE8C5|nr:phosphotransferase [Aureimonas sp. AU12]